MPAYNFRAQVREDEGGRRKGMMDTIRQMADDLRAIRRAYEADVAQRAVERGLDRTAGRDCAGFWYTDFLDALVEHGLMHGARAEKAKIKIRNGEIKW